MLLPIPVISHINYICIRCQLLTDRARIAENNRRQFHDYHIGEQMVIIIKDPDAFAERATTPFTLVNVHTNGTVSYLKNQNTISWINIRRIKPYIA